MVKILFPNPEILIPNFPKATCMPKQLMQTTYHFATLLHLADNAMILSQRNSEWCGHGPVLEQDIAITNISLDLLGQAKNLYEFAAGIYNQMTENEKQEADTYIPRLWKEFNRPLNEDDLAFLRDENQYLNILLVELPKGDWAVTILRQFFFSTYQYNLYTHLKESQDKQLAAIAEKSLKEVTYHLRWSSEWVIRLGDGTTESNNRINKALEELWPYTGEMFKAADYEKAENSMMANPGTLHDQWLQRVTAVFEEATLQVPAAGWMQSGGKLGRHTEHFGFILSEMQHLQKTYPNVSW